VEVSLLNYPGVTVVQATATMTVTECVVTAITPTPSLQGVAHSYAIFDAPLEIPYDYVQVPACGYPQTTTITPTSSAFTFDPVNKNFVASSSDTSDVVSGLTV